MKGMQEGIGWCHGWVLLECRGQVIAKLNWEEGIFRKYARIKSTWQQTKIHTRNMNVHTSGVDTVPFPWQLAGSALDVSSFHKMISQSRCLTSRMYPACLPYSGVLINDIVRSRSCPLTGPKIATPTSHPVVALDLNVLLSSRESDAAMTSSHMAFWCERVWRASSRTHFCFRRMELGTEHAGRHNAAFMIGRYLVLRAILVRAGARPARDQGVCKGGSLNSQRLVDTSCSVVRLSPTPFLKVFGYLFIVGKRS